MLTAAIRRYLGAAFGVPIAILALGAGIFWVAIGFKSDALWRGTHDIPIWATNADVNGLQPLYVQRGR